jgi:predicted dehydrogenase
VRLARELITAGRLGEIRHCRARYLRSWGTDQSLMTWRYDCEQAGSVRSVTWVPHRRSRPVSGREIATVSGTAEATVFEGTALVATFVILATVAAFE